MVEVAIALILLTGYIIFNTNLYYGAHSNVVKVQQYTMGTNLLIKVAESVKAQSYEAVTDATYNYTTALYTYDISVIVNTEQYNGFDYKIVNVQVTWDNGKTLSVDILKYNPPVFTEV